MAGTRLGGKKAAATNEAREPGFYKRIGAQGGRNKGNTGGFATDIECCCPEIDHTHYLRQCAGKKGGRISRRTKKQASKEAA